MKHLTVLGLAFAFASLGSIAFGQDPTSTTPATPATPAVPTQSDAFSIKRIVKVGDTANYKLSAEFDFSGQQIDYTADVTEKVTDVATDGSYKVSSEQSNAKVNINGAEQDIPDQGGALITTYSASGVVLKLEGDDTEPGAYRMANLSATPAPDQPVKVGDSWTIQVPADSKTGAVAATADFKLLGTEKVGDIDSVKIQMSVKETEGTDKASNDGTVWLDEKTFGLVKSDTQWVNAPVPGAPGPINGKVVQTRA